MRELRDDFADVGDKDDTWLLNNVMQQWWDMVIGKSPPNKPETAVTLVTAELVQKVFSGKDGAEISDVQLVLCSLLAHYFAAVAVHAPWLRCFTERVSHSMPVGTVLAARVNSRYFDAAAFASTTSVAVVDEVARASTVMAFEFKRTVNATNAVITQTVAQTLEDAAGVIMAATPGSTTPCMFAFVGTAPHFDLLCIQYDFGNRALEVRRCRIDGGQPIFNLSSKSVWADAFANTENAISLLKPIHRVIRHVVHVHDLGSGGGGGGELVAWPVPATTSSAAPVTSGATAPVTLSSSGASAPTWRVPRPLVVKSSFELPSPIPVTGALLSQVFASFSGTAPVFPADSTIKFESILSATERRVVYCVQAGDSAERRQSSAVCERNRVQRVVDLFHGELSSVSGRVHLPIGYIDSEWPVLVSGLWPGRSLAAGCIDEVVSRIKVLRLLESQIFPVIMRMRERGFFYIDLHPGNVMVNDDLTEAWLIDFEGAIQVDDDRGTPERQRGVLSPKLTKVELENASNAQMEALRARFAEK